MSVKASAAALVAITIALGGCGQSLLDSPQRDAQSSGVFDWLDAPPSAAEPRKRQRDKSSSGEFKHAEIYFGDGVAQNQGQLRTADLHGTATLELRVNTNDKGSPKGVTRTEDGINLNFENAEIKSVVRAVLGDILNLNFTIDPGVSGTISLSTRRPIRREQLLPLLETALRSRGAIMVQNNGFVRIVPDRDAVGMGGVNVGKNAGTGGYGITALPLENISADALSKILEGFGAPAGSVRVDPERNLLIVRGSSGERQQLIDTALAFDVDWMRNQTVGIFPVRHTSPDAIISELGKLSGATAITYQPIERMNAILAVAKSADAIQRASSWISRLDRTSDAGSRVRVYRLKYADARRVAALVRDMFGSRGSQTQLGVESGLLAPKAERVAARVAPAAKASTTAGSQTDARPDAAGAVDTPGFETGTATASIRITADVANNAIVVHSGQQDAILIERAIRDLDRAPAQVAIEATIAEITLNDSLNNGVQFYLRGKWGAISQSQDNPPLARVVPGLNLVLGNEASPKLVLDALRAVTEVKVLSSPSLVVVDNQPAVLQVGDQVPITTRTAQAVTDPLAPIVNSIDFRDTGVILRITPQVHADSTVGIDIEQEISSVKGANDGTETLTPTISQRRVKSTVSVADGQTLLLAGLISEQRSKGKSGTPGVIDIPLLGNILAGKNSDEKTRTELIIFIRPQVIRSMVDARRVAEGLRQRMKGFERW
jgi:general secretion pathway protein D